MTFVPLVMVYKELTSCYSVSTILEVSAIENTLVLHLSSQKQKSCEILPSGVKILLSFDDTILNLQKTLINFDYTTTADIIFDVPDNSLYFALPTATFTILSYNQRYKQQIQEITIIRNKELNVFTNLIVDYDQTVFSANVTYPFAEIDVKSSQLIIRTYLATYVLECDGVPIYDVASKQATLNFPNSTLSLILYETGLTNIEILIVYGTTTDMLGSAITSELVYKGQPNPGKFNLLKVFDLTFLYEIDVSQAFYDIIKKSSSIGILFNVNNAYCGFKYDIPSKDLISNIDQHQKIMQIIDMDLYSNKADFIECFNILKNDCKKQETNFMIYDEQNIARDRFVIGTSRIIKTNFENATIILGSRFIEIKVIYHGTNKNATELSLNLQLFKTHLDSLNFNNQSALSINFTLKGDISIRTAITKEQHTQIDESYSTFIQLIRENGQIHDSFQSVVENFIGKQDLYFNLIVISISVVICCILGGIQIFLSSKSKKIVVTKIKHIDMEELN